MTAILPFDRLTFLIGFFSLCFSFNSPAQLAVQTYDSGQSDLAQFLFPTTNGELVFGGGSFGGPGEQLQVFRATTDGELQWSFFIDGDISMRIIDGLETENGDLVFTGYAADWDMGGQNTFILRLSAEGELIFHEVYVAQFISWSFAIAECQNGDLVICGTELLPGADADMLVMRVSAEGEEIWTNSYGGACYQELNGVGELENGDLIFGGFTEVNCMDDLTRDLVILRTDENGEQLELITVDRPENETARKMRLTPDGNLLFCGYVTLADVLFYYSDPLILLTTLDGEILLDYAPQTETEDTIEDAVVSASGDIYLTGGIADYPNYIDAVIYSLSSEGELIEEYVFDSGYYDYGAGIGLIDGVFYAVTSNFSNDLENSDVFVLSPDGSTEIGHTPGSELSIFPNPASSHLTIISADQGAQYHLMDMNGKLVVNGTISSERQHVDLSALSSGVYVLATGQKRIKVVVQ